MNGDRWFKLLSLAIALLTLATLLGSLKLQRAELRERGMR
jgi:hypothetical protein